MGNVLRSEDNNMTMLKKIVILRKWETEREKQNQKENSSTNIVIHRWCIKNCF